MNNENLIEYMDKVEVLNKEISIYFNKETGVKKIVPTTYLLVGVDYFELTDQELEKARFDMLVDKDIEFETKMVKRPRVKYDITKIEADKNKLVDTEVKVNCIWNVSNSLKVKKTFNNKKEALELYDRINKPMFNKILN